MAAASVTPRFAEIPEAIPSHRGKVTVLTLCRAAPRPPWRRSALEPRFSHDPNMYRTHVTDDVRRLR